MKGLGWPQHYRAAGAAGLGWPGATGDTARGDANRSAPTAPEAERKDLVPTGEERLAAVMSTAVGTPSSGSALSGWDGVAPP